MARGALAATARCGSGRLWRNKANASRSARFGEAEPIQSGKTISSENPSKFNVSLLGA